MTSFPWEHEMRTDKYYSHKHLINYKRTYATITDNKSLVVRKGDLFQISKGIISQPHDWREWFLKKKEYKKYIIYDPKIPEYCRGQWALVLNRYKYMHYKMGHWYENYGTLALILTGPKRGKIKRFYNKLPFRCFIKFDVLKYNDKSNFDFLELKINTFSPLYVNKNDDFYYKKVNINKFIQKHNISRDNEKSIDLLVKKFYDLARKP